MVPRRVRFAAANTGHGAYGEPHKLDRYLDPEHERALASLRAANVAYRARQDADRQRRQALGCANAHRLGSFGDRRPCECVYCRPQDHLSARELAASAPHLFPPPSCLCATPTPDGGRCLHHRDVELVVLDGDPPALRQLADRSGGDRR
ncbi:MAG: hypothetical protein WD250_09790 [Egibacteraceae bacterium]